MLTVLTHHMGFHLRREWEIQTPTLFPPCSNIHIDAYFLCCCSVCVLIFSNNSCPSIMPTYTLFFSPNDVFLFHSFTFSPYHLSASSDAKCYFGYIYICGVWISHTHYTYWISIHFSVAKDSIPNNIDICKRTRKKTEITFSLLCLYIALLHGYVPFVWKSVSYAVITTTQTFLFYTFFSVLLLCVIIAPNRTMKFFSRNYSK